MLRNLNCTFSIPVYSYLSDEKIKRWVLHVDQDLLILSEHIRSPQVISVVCVAHAVFSYLCCVLCTVSVFCVLCTMSVFFFFGHGVVTFFQLVSLNVTLVFLATLLHTQKISSLNSFLCILLKAL